MGWWIVYQKSGEKLRHQCPSWERTPREAEQRFRRHMVDGESIIILDMVEAETIVYRKVVEIG